MSTEPSFRAVSLPTLSDPDAERIESQARTRGHSAGYAAGLRSAQKQLLRQQAAQEAAHADLLREGRVAIDRSLGLLAAAIRAAESRLLPVLQEAEDALAVAAIDLAEAVLGHELSDGERSARSALTRVLGNTPSAGLTRIRMNPDDLAVLDAGSLARSSAEFVADQTVQRGDAVAELPDGILDARIGSALARARAVLVGDGS